MGTQRKRQEPTEGLVNHSIRAAFLRLVAATRSSITPREALTRLKGSSTVSDELRLGTVVYHARVLENAGLLKRGEFDPTRGMPFTVTPAGELAVLRMDDTGIGNR